jgi:hypothetical protein
MQSQIYCCFKIIPVRLCSRQQNHLLCTHSFSVWEFQKKNKGENAKKGKKWRKAKLVTCISRNFYVIPGLLLSPLYAIWIQKEILEQFHIFSKQLLSNDIWGKRHCKELKHARIAESIELQPLWKYRQTAICKWKIPSGCLSAVPIPGGKKYTNSVKVVAGPRAMLR